MLQPYLTGAILRLVTVSLFQSATSLYIDTFSSFEFLYIDAFSSFEFLIEILLSIGALEIVYFYRKIETRGLFQGKNI